MQPVFLLDLEIQSHFFGGLLTEQSQLWPLQLQLLAQASSLLDDYDSDQQMNQFFDHRSVNYQGPPGSIKNTTTETQRKAIKINHGHIVDIVEGPRESDLAAKNRPRVPGWSPRLECMSKSIGLFTRLQGVFYSKPIVIYSQLLMRKRSPKPQASSRFIRLNLFSENVDSFCDSKNTTSRPTAKDAPIAAPLSSVWTTSATTANARSPRTRYSPALNPYAVSEEARGEGVGCGGRRLEVAVWCDHRHEWMYTIMEDWCKILEEDRAFMRSGTAGHEEGL
ncbi:hypothetical protein B0H13DRAFT_1857207 [Mycena leptocephala]|nr:hypothetical protein B0H13DRAFT_1857207 [Mycena leptocephala]